MSNSVAVRSTGFTSATLNNNAVVAGNRTAFTLSNGHALVVVFDVNAAGSTNGDHSGNTKVYIYESTNRITFTLRGTSTVPVAATRWSAALYTDNSVGIICSPDVPSATGYRFIKFTYSGYSFGSWETITLPSYRSGFADITITDTDLPVLACVTTNSAGTSTQHEIWIRLASGAWTQITTFGTQASTYNASWSATITALGITGSLRRIVLESSGVNIGDDGANIRTLKVNETTGAISGVLNLVSTFASGENNHINTSGRNAKLFRTGSDEWTLGLQHFGVNRSIGVVRGTYDGTTNAITVPYFAINSGLTDIFLKGGGITYGNDCLNFVYTPKFDGEYHPMLGNFIAKINRVSSSVTISGPYEFNNYNTTYNTYYVSSGGDRNIISTSYFDTLFLENDTTNNHLARHIYTNLSSVVMSSLLPAAASTTTNSNPPLGVSVALGLKYGYSRYKIRWQFAKDTGFTTNLVDYYARDIKLKKINGTQAAGSVVRFNDALSLLYRLPQGDWYFRTAVIDEFGNVSAFSNYIFFTIAHPPSASNLSPGGGSVQTWNGGLREFTFKFNDLSTSDTQTALQIVIESNATGDVIYDSGKLTQSASSLVITLPIGAKDISLRWKVKVWDTDDVAGPYSEYALFTASDPPVVSLDNPTDAQVLTSGVPEITFTPTLSGGRTVVAYQAYITKADQVIWTSGPIITTPISSGTPITVVGDKSYLVNNNSYSVYAVVTDSIGLNGTSPINRVTTVWVPPLSPTQITVDASLYDTEDGGYVTVGWNDQTRDPDFNGWNIYRRDDQVDPDHGTVVETGEWKLIYTEFNTQALYEFRDYLAPSNGLVSYRVRQVVNRAGDIIESINIDSTSVTPFADAYWLVVPRTISVIASGIKIPSVTSDDYTDEFEESEYVIIGRGRHVDIGQHLGYKGSITTKIRSTGFYTARQKRQKILEFKELNSVAYLRNPFGDVFKVSVSNIGVSRIAGVGKAEFVDLSIPYGEVG